MSERLDRTKTTRPLGAVLAENMSNLTPKFELERVLARFPDCVQRELSNLLTDVRCRSCSQNVFDLSVEDLSTYVVCRAAIDGYDQTLRMVLSRQALLGMSSVLFGGVDDGTIGRRDRTLGTLDRRAVQMLFVSVSRALVLSFASDGTLQVGVPEVVTNPTAADLKTSANEVILINIELLLTSLVAPMLLLVPRFKPVGTEAPEPHLPKTRLDAREGKALDVGGVSRTPVPLVAYLEACPLTFAEVSNLQVGDTLALVGDSAARVRLETADEALFSGILGSQGGLLAVHIDQVVDHDGDIHAEFSYPAKCAHS